MKCRELGGELWLCFNLHLTDPPRLSSLCQHAAAGLAVFLFRFSPTLLFSAARLCGLQDCVCTVEQEAELETHGKHEQQSLSSEDRRTFT